MKLSTILNAGILATSVMTCFSDMISDHKHISVREPGLLASHLRRLKVPGSAIVAWHAHYSIGMAWTLLYAILLKKGLIKNNKLVSASLGAASGVVSVACWRTMNTLMPGPSPSSLRKFYAQLIPAHVVFTVIAMEILKDSDHPEFLGNAPHPTQDFFTH